MDILASAQLDQAHILLQRHGVVFAGLFGSRAKSTAHPDSDFDILIEFEPGKRYSLFDLIEISDELKDVLAAPVDLITTASLNPHIKQEVLHSLIPLYDRR